VNVFHAGTARDSLGRFVTNGGRVLAVTGVGQTLVEARQRAYAGASLVNFEGRVMRSDIALGAIRGDR
jgi:phosphoribosylamine--glycine ligase